MVNIESVTRLTIDRVIASTDTHIRYRVTS